MTATHVIDADTAYRSSHRTPWRQARVPLLRIFIGYEFFTLEGFEHEAREDAPDFTHDVTIGLRVAVIWVDDGGCKGVGGGEGDGAAGGQAGHVVGHDDRAVDGGL